MACIFQVGEMFDDFPTLEEKIHRFARENMFQTWKRSSRKIAASQRGEQTRSYSPSIVYSEIWFACVHSGSHSSRSKGDRPNTKTCRKGCLWELKIRASGDGQKLVVKKFVNEHNHECKEVVYERLASQRTLHCLFEL